jgi:predicted proteasome-type protease
MARGRFRLLQASAAQRPSRDRPTLEERVTYCLGILNDATSLDEAAKLSLLSFDATMRSNLSVDAPIDRMRYRADSFSAHNFATLEKDDPYWMALRTHYAEGLSSLVASIAPPPNRT